MSDLNDSKDLQNVSPSYKLNFSLLSVRSNKTSDFDLVDCEYCGLKYKSLQDKNLHQIYYCIGRDLSLDKSILRIRNNNSKNKSLNNVASSITSVKSTVNDTSNEIKPLNITSFKYPSSVLKTPRVIHGNQSLDSVKASDQNNKNIKKIVTDSSINSSRSTASTANRMESTIKVYVLRLRPNQDLLKELDKFVADNDLKAAFVMTCVGSLTKATVRMAYSGLEQNEVKVYNEHLEIVSLVGTLSSTGGHHLHISLSNKDGNVLGGHVFGEMNVFTTAEIVIGECVSLKFDREYDNQSGFDELVVKQRENK